MPDVETKNTFGCSSCSSFCCITPPMLNGEVELSKAIALGADVVATKLDPQDEAYYVSVAKDARGVCPFLLEEGGCSIYEERFDVCKRFVCKATGMDHAQFLCLSPDAFYEGLSLSKDEMGKPILAPEEIVKKHGVRIVDMATAQELLVKLDISVVAEKLSMLYFSAS